MKFEHMSDNCQLILQVLGMKRMAYNNIESYRLLVSDGGNTENSTVLSSHLNHLVVDGKLDRFAIIKVSKYTTRLLKSGLVHSILH